MPEFLLHAFAFRGYDILWLDFIALLWFFANWGGYAMFADLHYHRRVNLIRIMDDMRTRWMLGIVNRENRIYDATLLGNIMRVITFFASTTILVLIGLFTLLGAESAAEKIIRALPFVIGSNPLMWEIKVCLLVFIFIYAFFKLTWSLRQYNYACINVGAAPFPRSDISEARLREFALRTAKMMGSAGKHFNLGLRAYYFGMAAVSWFINGILFMAVTSLVVWVVYRREFRSHTVNNLIAIDDL